ncbi:glycosyltransferase [Ferrovum sp. PN-J185]|uniref:glycosyltransferase n=1 Tax=Ferrovum sp. PN-J185 TaxID=1356306 RepID=UPI00079BC6DB|nr:glycosyltransferase [Ferrovum sp. PN-J185]KXW55831.1 N-glycosyltransferase [Ferrovum sp. PN-J185]
MKLYKYSVDIFSRLLHIRRPYNRQDIKVGNPFPIYSNSILIQKIDVRPFSINRLAFLIATYQRVNNCKLSFSLFSNVNQLLFNEVVSAELLVDNSFYFLNLPDDFNYKGELYIVISSPDATSSNCVALWTEMDVGGSALYECQNIRKDIIDLKFLLNRSLKYPSLILKMSISQQKFSNTLRSYLRDFWRPSLNPIVTIHLALVGFDQSQIKLLLQLKNSYDLKVSSLKFDELESFFECQAILIPVETDLILARSLGKIARRRKIPLILVDTRNNSMNRKISDDWLSFADGFLGLEIFYSSRLPSGLLTNGLHTAVEEIFNKYQIRRSPKVSIITILSGKSDQLRYVIKSYFNQTYEGDIEVIYIDDCFGNTESIIHEEFSRYAIDGQMPKLTYRIIKNERNLGNCASRNRGIASSTGDIIVIIDADCIINSQFIAAHVDAHSYLDCEVVIGPCNIETNGVPPLQKLAEIESKAGVALAESDLQDKIYLDSFLNCITRNFSIKKKSIVEDLFDLDFSYSLSSDSGFGWEDVEMGYRLYKRGLGIKFTEDAFSIHISHTSSVPEIEKPKRSIRNFRKLFLKHPELRDIARRWATKTLNALNDWSYKVDPLHDENTDLLWLKNLFFGTHRITDQINIQHKKLRVLTYRWHVPHQYELYKSGHDFFLVKGLGTPLCENWQYEHRPLPTNAHFINIEDVNELNFDLALLHFDENVLNHENTNGKIGPEWGATFRHFVEKVNLPKVAVCHGTPQFHGQYTPNYDKPDLMAVIEPARLRLVEYVKNIEIICNSYQAQREWGFFKSRVIWHGFDPAEFLPSTYTKGILSPQGPLVNSRPHYRGFYIYQQVFSTDFPKEFSPETLNVPDPDIEYIDNIFAVAKYKNYIDQIRQYSVYFNPTLRSPMPRARCEPMMCGIVTVNTNNHDVDLFIKNGINGFYSNEPDELREQLVYLMRNPVVIRKMGEQSRKTAIDIFNHDRYLAEWSMVFKSFA